ncbi:ArdC-like ssDNA-binding domain-containing protein [Ruminococcus flavefaciens]|uniref:ArdC-like ssDNA-binding domain-containing protein n=1 Tax=Ruminococcus flavefaciens TaxID=1265 RepID=UPI0026EEAC88|nr:ArdC-like ssDNA-binding domain-containing protein [Ruminococcus flavefaciens]
MNKYRYSTAESSALAELFCFLNIEWADFDIFIVSFFTYIIYFKEVDNTAWKKRLTPQQKAEYKAEKREKMQSLFKKIDDGVKAVFESDSYKKCLRYMSKFTNYSAGNCILIMLQKPDASLVAAFGKWKELGRTINKGEKGIAILAPMSFKSKELKEQPVRDSSGNQVYNADGSEKKEEVEVEQTSIGFKKVYVFDVSQTSGEPIPEYVHELNEAVEDEQVEAVINAVHDITGLPVDFENIKSGAKGYYNYGEQRIVIQENLSGAQAVKTAIHECAHALLHDPDKKLPTANTSRSDKEVQAESVAYIVASRYGIDTSDYSFPYIASWSQGKQLEQLNRFLNEIQETARTICDAIDSELQELVETQTEETTEDECLGLAL